MLGNTVSFGRTTHFFFQMAGALICLPDAIFNGIRNAMNNLIEHKNFNRTAELISLGNPIAIAPQLWNVYTASPEALQGVSITMFVMFLILQSTMGLIFLKNKNRNMFFVMLLLVAVTSATITVTLVRR